VASQQFSRAFSLRFTAYGKFALPMPPVDKEIVITAANEETSREAGTRQERERERERASGNAAYRRERKSYKYVIGRASDG